LNEANVRLIFVIALAGVMLATPATPKDEASEAGQKWLAYLDDLKYEESWNQAGSMFRSEVKKDQWIDSLKRARGPLGALVSRTADRVDLVTTLRGAPDGEYAIIHFTTALQNKTITERLTLVKEDGRWQTAAYAIH
jgi:hypothetical protein